MQIQGNRLQIQGADRVAPATVEKLQQTAERALDFFEGNFGPIARPVKLDLSGGEKSLRTGYNPTTDTVYFPDQTNLQNSGLDSVDVINHELFHALVGQTRPDLSTPEKVSDPKVTALQEGLADYFAYQLNPDEHFGEDYQIGKPYLRSYRNDLAVSLAAGPHAQGNAITSYLLKNEVTPHQIGDFLAHGEFSLAGLGAISPGLQADLSRDAAFAFDESVSPNPYSSKGRYRLADDQPLQFSFHPSASLREAHPDLRVDWQLPSGMPSQHYVVRGQGDDYTVEQKPGASAEKLLALFKDGERVVGFRPYYFGPVLPLPDASPSSPPAPQTA